MPVVHKPHDQHIDAAGRSDRKDPVRHGVLTTTAIMAIFLGLVVLPQTRANIWWPSSAGDSNFLVGP